MLILLEALKGNTNGLNTNQQWERTVQYYKKPWRKILKEHKLLNYNNNRSELVYSLSKHIILYMGNKSIENLDRYLNKYTTKDKLDPKKHIK